MKIFHFFCWIQNVSSFTTKSFLSGYTQMVLSFYIIFVSVACWTRIDKKIIYDVIFLNEQRKAMNFQEKNKEKLSLVKICTYVFLQSEAQNVGTRRKTFFLSGRALKG